MELPVSYDFKEATFELKGRHSVSIENYRKILTYTSEHILLLTKVGLVHIYGQNLSIAYYTLEDMKIVGKVQSICFGEEHPRR